MPAEQRATAAFRGKRILVLERSFIIAEELRALVTVRGHIALTPAATVKRAIEIAAAEEAQGAILAMEGDCGECFLEAAEYFECRALPYILLSATLDGQCPDHLARHVRIEKPWEPRDMDDAIERTFEC